LLNHFADKFPIPLLNPPPSQREGGRNYQIPPLFWERESFLFLSPLLWRGRCRWGRFLDLNFLPRRNFASEN